MIFRSSIGAAAFVALLVARIATASGLEWTPQIAWTSGDHRVALSAQSRLRWELWEALTDNDDNIYGVRTRLGLDYTYDDRFRLFAQGQLTQVLDLDDSASGAALAYRANATNPNANDVTSIRVRQLFGEARFGDSSWLRVGRQDIMAGTLIGYDEPDWKALKSQRLAQRLVGTVGWTHGERSYDGVSARLARDGHVVHLYAAEPTTGVFEIDSAYKRQRDVIFGGIEWTVEQDVWLPDTELGAFFLGYSDDRDPSKVAGLFGDIEIYTLGLSAFGITPVGPGRFDWILWGALQLGEYHDMTPSGVRNLDHFAGAFVAEAGYQFPDVPLKPWVRAGLNFASGDGSPDDGDHNTFFNVLPTNHLYYGYADQLAFANLVDLLAQLKMTLLPRVGLEVAFHQFWLHREDDARYFGTGAFARTSLGYGRSPSNGANDVGREIDVVLQYRHDDHLAVAAGYSRLFGGQVLESFADADVNWAFVQITLAY